MKQTLILLFVLISALKVEAKKMISPLVVVAASADIVVIGEIDVVKKDSYTFRISETLKGQTYKTISVEMFKEWTCDTRFAKPKKGQQLCLFLKKGMSHWTIIDGSTGELSISGKFIALGGEDSIIIVNDKISQNKIPLLEFKNTIRDFCKSYVFIGEYGYRNQNPQYFKQIISDKQIAVFKKASKFSTWLFEKMTTYPVRKS